MRYGSYFLILGFFLMFIVCVSAVSAEDNISDVLGDESSSDEKLCQKNGDAELSQDIVLVATNNEYDKVVDHRPEMDEYNRIYTPFEVNPGETFVKDIGLTHIEIKNLDNERSYHEITYTYKNGQKVIDDEWSCGLNLGAKNVNRDGLIVCHVLLHGNEIIKERQPVYKTVKVNKKVSLAANEDGVRLPGMAACVPIGVEFHCPANGCRFSTGHLLAPNHEARC